MLSKLQAKWRELKWIASLLVLTVSLSLFVYHLASFIQPLPLPLPQISSFPAFEPPLITAKQKSNDTDNIEADDRGNLERILREASTEEKTVIVTMMNQAYAERDSTFDVFLESFRVGNGTERLLRHVVVVCLDEKSYSRCVEVFPRRCFLLRTTGIDFSGERLFMKGDYLKMMWRRTEFLGSLLSLGYNFLFTDMDTVWLRDPFPRFIADVDFQIACDSFNGNISDTRNYANGGFKYVIANPRTIEFYNYWYESRLRFPGKNEQDVINKIKNDRYIKKMGLKMRFLNTRHVGNFCQQNWDITKVCVMHGNCCIGQTNKVKDLRQVLEDWTNFFANGDRKRGFRQPMNCRRSLRRKRPHKSKAN
uniref:Nucleotide-diphospho-sugar transferase domain-containing protein n=1 Tax=Noccaea caerulescens TaxID=107243 RepID=A0A1J3CBG7_NOCCA